MHQTKHEFPLLMSDARKIERIDRRYWRKENDSYILKVSEGVVYFLTALRISKDLREVLVKALMQGVEELEL